MDAVKHKILIAVKSELIRPVLENQIYQLMVIVGEMGGKIIQIDLPEEVIIFLHQSYIFGGGKKIVS